MIVASIDIGSNTVLLLIAKIDKKNNIIHSIKNFYKSPRISKGLLPGSEISNDKINELLNVLEEYNKIIASYSCKNVFVTATNAFRIASNAHNILQLIKTRFDWDVNIISGPEEAKLSFYGAAFPFQNNIESKTVIDIGGGSTEIISGNSIKIKYLNSFNIGVVSLTEKNIHNTAKTKEYLLNLFNELKTVIPPANRTIAVAGTPTTLTCINQNLKIYNETLVENSELTLENVKTIFYNLKQMNVDEITNRYGEIVEGRADVLTAGTLILLTLMEILQLDKITVSSKGLRYGVVTNYLMNL